MKKFTVSFVMMAAATMAACTDEPAGRKDVDAYCYMMEQCQYGQYATCYDSTNAALAAEPYEECRAARKLLLDCLGHLDCIEYVRWSQEETGSQDDYPCRDQDNLVAYTCGEP